MSNKDKIFTLPKIGASLSLCGVPLSMYLNYIYHINVGWSPILTFLSVILLINWKNLSKFRFPMANKVFGIILLFQVIMIIYGGFSMTMTNQYFAFHLYIIGLCIAYSTMDRNESFENFPETLCYISIPCLVLGFYFAYNNLITGDEVYELRQTEVYFIEPFTVSAGIIYFMIGLLTINNNTFAKKCFIILSILLALYVMLNAGKRTPIIIIIGIIATSLFIKRGKNTFFDRNTIILISIVILCVLWIYNHNGMIHEAINNTAFNTYYGIRNLLGDTSVRETTGSTLGRIDYRNYAYDYITFNFTELNYLFGAGYLTKWLDAPLLESFLDMGLVGAAFYSYLAFVFPFKTLKDRIPSRYVNLGILASLMTILSSFSSGNPYSYIKYTPICYLAFAYYNYKYNAKK